MEKQEQPVTILLILIPLALLLGLSGLVAFYLAAKSGQFEDLVTPALRALLDETERKVGK